MDYKCPDYADLGGIGAPMNPLFVSEAVALGPTRVMDVPTAGYASMPSYGLDGRHVDRDYFQPGQWELSGRYVDRDYFAPGQWELSGRYVDRDYFQPGQWELSGWRDAMDVFTAASFLFPE